MLTRRNKKNEMTLQYLRTLLSAREPWLIIGINIYECQIKKNTTVTDADLHIPSQTQVLGQKEVRLGHFLRQSAETGF